MWEETLKQRDELYKRYRNDYNSLFELRRTDGEFMAEDTMTQRVADEMNQSGQWNGTWVRANSNAFDDANYCSNDCEQPADCSCDAAWSPHQAPAVVVASTTPAPSHPIYGSLIEAVEGYQKAKAVAAQM